MILVIGGAWQGKEAYVREQLLRKLRQTDPDAEYVVENAYHLKIREQMKAKKEPLEAAKELLEATEGKDGSGKGAVLVVICDEVGYGVVPMDAFERAWREKVGRVCCYFAQEAGQVIRVVCGVGSRIK